MSQNLIITIGRQCGAGGTVVADIISGQLGMKVYNDAIVDRAAADSGISRELMKEYDEKANTSFLYSLVMDSYAVRTGGDRYAGAPLEQKVFMAQYDAIQKLAEEAPCIFIGRCADYALEKHTNCIRVFLSGDDEDRIKRLSALHQVDEKKAKEIMVKTDKRRSSYYNYNTNRKWGAAVSYDLCINTSKVGYEGAAKLIMDYVKDRNKAV